MSGEIHMNENRQMTTCLIGLSEDGKHEDVNNFKNTVNDNWTEAVTPWKSIASHPRYYPHQVSYVIKRKQKPVDPRVPDWQRSNFVDGETKQTVRCVNDELENGPYLHWKGMVEQVTYRYVPHNGYYRTMKFLSFDKREWYTVNKKQPEQVSMSWQSKRYQKELKRQLKKDLENKKEKDSTKKETIIESIQETNGRTDIEISDITECNTDRSRKRPKSTKSSQRQQTDEEGFLVPAIQSAPLPGDLYKSRSDLYIENITLRISALEREIANDSKLRKTQDDMVKPLFRPKVKENGNVTPRPYKKESLPEEVFAAKRVNTPDTKLPEKLAPISRMTSTETKSAPVTHLKYTTSSGNDTATVNLPTIDLEKTLNSYKLAIENTRQSLLNTLNGKQISRRTTITGKNYNSPTTITICDSGDGSEKGSVKEYIRPIKGEKRFRDKKESVGVALLPGIAGKRLEVPTTTHRWL